MKLIHKILATAMLVVCVGCEQRGPVNHNERLDTVGLAGESMSVMSQKSGNAQPQKINIEKKLIKNGNISFETEDLAETKTTIVAATKKYQAYISSDNAYTSQDRISNTLTVRVPASSFDDFLKDITEGIEELESKNINISDVTEQFLDIEARLRTKKKLEERFTQLLAKANNVRELLDIERQLANVRSEIESVEGRLKYLSNQVDFSTLTITFYKKTANETNFGRKLKNGFKNGINNLKWFFIYLINVWPFVILTIVIIYIVRKRIKNKKNNS